MFLGRSLGAAPLLIVGALALPAANPVALQLRTNDVVAFIGGSDVAAAQHTGHLEALLAIQFPGVRFRNFGWEGDTVFAQRRDVGFPPLREHLRRSRATVLFLEFGRAEALDGKQSVSNFFRAYDGFIAECAKQAPRIVLLTPPPFESGGGLLPDLSARNKDLAGYVNAIRTLARQRSLPVIDLFAEWGGASHEEPRLTDNGLQLTARGHALIASGVVRQLGALEIAARAGAVSADAAWSNKQFENLRQLVLEKNRLWFNYWRPQNWAFLGGDRTTQPSSRDHRDPNVRWFPAEMEKYGPLIRAKEEQIERAAALLRTEGK